MTSGRWYTLEPQHAPGMAMDVDNSKIANGTNIRLCAYNNANAQQFGFVKVGDTYRIVTKVNYGTKNLSLASPFTTDGANIHQWSYGVNDFWWLERVNFGCAWAFKSKNNWQAGEPNCFGYALGLNDTPPLVMNQGDSVSTVATRVENYVKSLGRQIRRISGPTAQINNNEYRFCMRVGNHSNLWPPYDYHFWVQTNMGAWTDKHGTTEVSTTPVFAHPSLASWDMGNHKNYYDSATIYFAATLN